MISPSEMVLTKVGNASTVKLRRLFVSPTRAAARQFAAKAQGTLLFAIVLAVTGFAQDAQTAKSTQQSDVPPLVTQARRFLAQRNWPGKTAASVQQMRMRVAATKPLPQASGNADTAAWQPIGPKAVTSPSYGLVTGRVSSIAIDPADPTGNSVYVGTTGGGVWFSQNAGASPAGSVVFTPLTDSPAALSGARDASISIGALSVQPGGTGVILAGTGDPNDALDSYYGGGVLRSTDGGGSWSLIQTTADQMYSFVGEGFAGFAWSTSNPQLVVAAVSEAYEGTLVNAARSNVSSAGLYYSTDGGASWSLALITDGAGGDVQGPADVFVQPNGNVATAVVWNPVRQMFIAAVRFHGYYQSTDGATWMRMVAQPGAGLTTHLCPANPGSIGSAACPIFRGALAVNPISGDTFAWTVDVFNQDQGLWRDQCAISGGTCSNQTVAFSAQVNTATLEANTIQGIATISNGDYNLILAAVPSGQDTFLLAGANDVWKCSLASGCVWRNTTNANACMSAQVAGYQHALAWNATNPQEIFIGNDGGLWRSTDAIGETGLACDPADASHFENLNAGLGSLAEVASMSQGPTSPYTMMTGLGVIGTAGVKSVTGPPAQWPQILGGEGGPVAIDPTNAANWFVNNHAGVSIHRCSQSGDCNASAFGTVPVVGDSDVSGDGSAMATPAPFIMDPLDPTQLLVGTCRVWRGPAGGGWTVSNAVSPMLDGARGKVSCENDALIRAIAALPLASGGEVIYVGMYGAADGGLTLAGHVLKATYDPSSSAMPAWQDLTFNPVSNDALRLNYYGLDISSIFVDPHDPTGNTVYVTVQGFLDPAHNVRVAYGSADGGAHWAFITSNLPSSPANSLVIDPQDANTAYIATDNGVYSTRQIATCATAASHCWSAYGTGLPQAPVVQLVAAPATASLNVLAAATYGRGVWQIPLWTAGTQITTATVAPGSLAFASRTVGATSPAQTLTLTNTGGVALTPTAIVATGDFTETDNCTSGAINTGASCAIQVTFTPSQSGDRPGQLAISANVSGGQLAVALDGTGTSTGLVGLSPGSLSFGQIAVGSTSSAQSVTVGNAGVAAVSVSSSTAGAPFSISTNACGSSLAANSDCEISVVFKPTQLGMATGILTLVDAAGTQTVALSGTGAATATDVLSPSSLAFPATVSGQLSTAQNVVLTNSGDLPLNSIAASTSAGFQASDNCGGSLAGHASCAISVVFAPTQVGGQSGTLKVSDASQTQTVALSGTGLQPPSLSVNSAQISFAAQPVGSASAPATLNVSNTGGAAMANVGFQITGPAATSFSTGLTTCGSTLTAGSVCTVQVIFTPTAAGASAATLIISSSTIGVAAVQVPLSGTGQAVSGLSVSPAQMAFTQPAIGQASASQTAAISNLSSVVAGGLTLTLTGPFSLTQNACGSTLAAGASCTAGIVFTPIANGTSTGSLTVSSPAFASPVTLALSGAGGAAGAAQIQPAVLNFPTTGVGTASAAQSVTITNSGTVAFTDLAVAASGAYQLTATTCAAALAPGATCTVSVVFAPTGAGQQSGTLTASSSMLAASVQTPLSGMGFDFTTSITGGSSQTVSSGQTARYTLTLSPMSGSSGTFAFQCDTLPAHATCTFNPAGETVAANTTGSVTVQISTGQGTTSGHMQTPPIGAAWLPVALGLIALPFAWHKRRKNLLLIAMMCLVMAGVVSCSGGGGGSGGAATPPQTSNNTPAGKYSVGVTATASGVSHKVTLALTVD
jgi:Abnormal spindle-like microcephaly-assoc'd, ASPM-SPD-2-Hydin